jgi:peptidoglycan/LPS O-acetylase OafA/YrhL
MRWNLAPVLFAAPVCAVLYFSSDWQAWTGIPTPDTGLMPKLPALIGFGTSFSVGWLLHRQMDLFTQWQQRWHIHLVFAAGLTILCLHMAGLSPMLTVISPIGESRLIRLAYAVSYTIAAWCWVIAIIGCAMRFLRQANPVRRYIADSSYWLYLIHLPIILFLQVAMMNWNLHWSIKFALILAITVSFALITYHHLVRFTFIGSFLNGRRHRHIRESVAA